MSILTFVVGVKGGNVETWFMPVIGGTAYEGTTWDSSAKCTSSGNPVGPSDFTPRSPLDFRLTCGKNSVNLGLFFWRII